MDTRFTTTHGLRATSVWRPVAALLVAVALLATLAVPASAAATECLVTNLDTSETLTALQPAVDAASAGHRLTVEGTCHGTTTFAKDLLITGLQTETSGVPTLDGDGQGTVVTVLWAEVFIEGLTIEDGTGLSCRSSTGRHYCGGGITDRGGTLTLRDVVVRRNRGTTGDGIFNSGTLTLDGATRVVGNRPVRGGGAGGVYNKGTLTLVGASLVSRNWGGILNVGVLTLNGHSSISDNDMNGVENYGHGTVTLNDASSIRGNQDHGVDNTSGGAVIMNDTSSISGNWTGVENHGTVTLNDASSIRGNRVLGVDNTSGGAVIMNDTSSISGNWGGVENLGTLTLNGASGISRNSNDGVINGSSLDGPGAVVLNGSARITDNGRYRGMGGYFTYAGILNVEGAITLNNQAQVRRNRLWGVYNAGDGTLAMTGTSQIVGNRGTGKHGGGVHKGTLVGVTCGPGGNVHGNTPDDCVE